MHKYFYFETNLNIHFQKLHISTLGFDIDFIIK